MNPMVPAEQIGSANQPKSPHFWRPAFQAETALAAIEKRDRARIEAAVALLARTPRPRGLRGLSVLAIIGGRASGLRIIYEIRDGELVILVIRIVHRREVYRPPVENVRSG